MPLRPVSPRAYERIYLIGDANAGKTHAWLDMARLLHKFKSGATFYVVDSDFNVERMCGPDSAFADLLDDGVIEYRYVSDYREMHDATEKFYGVMGPNDWLVIDLFSYAWSWAQDFYSEEKYGKDLSTFLLAHAKSGVTGSEFSGDVDWRIIKSFYKRITDMVMRAQGHVICTAAVKDVSDRDSKVLQSTFKRFGVRPEGEKHSAHLFFTILLANGGAGGWRLQTVRDKGGRRELEGVEVGAGVMEGVGKRYLMDVANWRVSK